MVKILYKFCTNISSVKLAISCTIDREVLERKKERERERERERGRDRVDGKSTEPQDSDVIWGLQKGGSGK